MCSINEKNILFVYGEGGHSAQMSRLAPNLLELLQGFNAITLSDDKKKPNWSNVHFETSEFRNKHSKHLIFFNLGPLIILKNAMSIIKDYNVKVVVTTGPGLAISTALAAKFKGIKVIHIETWSRFTSYSLSGRVMYCLADKFYVQNSSLLKLYSKSTYSGRL